MMVHAESKGEIVIYRAPDGRASIDVRLEKDTIWLTQKQMAGIFETERSVITKHINNLLKTKELQLLSVCAKNAQVAKALDLGAWEAGTR